MNILFLSENFPPETNAAATRVHERACYWVKWGHRVTVITQAPNFPEGRLFPGYDNRWRRVEEVDGIRVVRVKTFIAPNRGVVRRTLDFLSFMATGIVAGLREPAADVVAATSPQFFAAVAGWLVAALRGRPFVFELGDLWPASIAAVGAMRPNVFLRLIERLELFLYGRAQAVAALTQSFKRNLVGRGVPSGKIAVVPNGVDVWRYGPGEPDQGLAAEWGLAGKFVVGYVGTHGMAHALTNVLDAAERLKADSGVRFLLVGAGAERRALIDEARRRDLANVVFMPPQPKQAMPAVWRLLDVALVHLKDDPLFAGVIPSKMFEAMASGVAVLLAAPEGEASRILSETGAGMAVRPGDPAALADAVRRLKDDPQTRRALAARGLAAAPGFSRERQARQMLAVLELAAAGRGAAAAAEGQAS
jgi:glycosyltransferase involved in cell wall biosynthesis